MKNINLTDDEIEIIKQSFTEYIFEYELFDLPMNQAGEYYGNDEFEELNAKRMNIIQNIYDKISGGN